MIGAIVIANLMYLVGAVAAMVLLSLAMFAHRRRPRSVEANVKTFHRGLEALAPDDRPRPASVPRGAGVATRPASRPAGVATRPAPRPATPVPYRPRVRASDEEPGSEAGTG